ncbi:hypothetical protein DM860_000195 [Cuscuta australis]|uniref:CRM domain-containing protein n=2 Tax=Cuscuta sect. Cleistogrammica TaxID=1824901 RepID=A0A328CYV3_9ASTE|nr:hypothetical protein DM860_000195 [Cuscuta australis]
MAILATLPGFDLFSNLPTTAPRQSPGDPRHRSTPPPNPPIPVPKYPPPLRSQKRPNNEQKPHQKPNQIPAFSIATLTSNYRKPVKPGEVISADGDRAVIVGESGVSYRLPGAPFEFQYSYSETPKVQPLAIREPAVLPFAPPTMPRPWTGKAPAKKSKRNIKLFGPLDPKDGNDTKQYHYEMLKAYELGKYRVRPRDEVLGPPLTRDEIKELLQPRISSNKQVNLGRDGLTHNMLELIHTHWRRLPVCKVRCLGVPTVDMDNICRCIEEKTGGKVIYRVGAVVYVFRGRNYVHHLRPQLPVMLWKPAAPVYPKLIQEAPQGLTKQEADEFREKGKKLLPICKLGKNGVYVDLVKDVRDAFEGSPLVKIDCKGLHARDYKKLGAKLKDLVPCVLLSFDEEQVLMWRGNDWKPRHKNYSHIRVADDTACLRSPGTRSEVSPRMATLWQRAVDSGTALLLDEINLEPDDLLKRVEEFEGTLQAMNRSYPIDTFGGGSGGGGGDSDGEDLINDDLLDVVPESELPFGSLPIDAIVEQFS